MTEIGGFLHFYLNDKMKLIENVSVRVTTKDEAKTEEMTRTSKLPRGRSTAGGVAVNIRINNPTGNIRQSHV